MANTNTKNKNSTYAKKTSTAKKTTAAKTAKVVKEEIVDKEFAEVEDDNRVIIFIIIALLIIACTLIGLIVGCEKKEDSGENKTDTVVKPVKKEETEEETTEEIDEEEETTETYVVKKVTKKEENNSKLEIVYYLGNKKHLTTIKYGNKLKKYVPSGYEDCNYYTDSNLENEVDMNQKITSGMNIYMSCSLVEYDIVYDLDVPNNPTSYNVDMGEYLLNTPTVSGIFSGWYADSNYTNKITKLTKDVMKKYAKNNVLHLYAKVSTQVNIKYHSDNGNVVKTDILSDENSAENYHIDGGQNDYCTSGTLLGYATNSGSNKVSYKNNANQALSMDEDLDLYAVCGQATIVYVSENNESVEVGYTEEEIDEIDLPLPEDLGMETPTYFVPVETPTETSKIVVSDDSMDLEENQITVSDVEAKAAESYQGNVEEGDYVEEKEKEFTGWEMETNDNPPETITETEEIETEINEEVDSGETEIELEANWEEQTEQIAA